MNIELKLLDDRRVWEGFLLSSKYSSFLQSWDWGEFQRSLGKDVWRVGISDNSLIVGVCMGIRERTRFGTYIYCPRGPVIDWKNQEFVGSVLSALKLFFRSKGVAMIRIDPALGIEYDPIMKNNGFKSSVNSVQVQRPWFLNIDGISEADLIKGMRKNARYYLKKGLKSGVYVRTATDESDMKNFVETLYNMSDRKKFVPISKKYLFAQCQYMVSSGLFKLFVAEYKGQSIAYALMSFYGGEVSYLHAATTGSDPETQPAYVLIWESIKLAQSLGLKKFNFWGVVKDSDYHPGHPGFGYSNFKRGFGGYAEEYMMPKEYPYSMVKYPLIRMLDRYRSKYRAD